MTELQSHKDGLSLDTADCCDHHVTQDISEECVSLVARTHKLGLIRTSLAHQTTCCFTRCGATPTGIGVAVLCWAAGRLAQSLWSIGHGLCCGIVQSALHSHRA